MQERPGSRHCIAIILVALVSVSTHAAPITPAFVAAQRSGDSAVFLSGADGTLFVQSGLGSPKQVLRLALPSGLQRRPTAIAQWRSEWFVANNTDKLLRFSADGQFLGEQMAPTVISGLAAAGEILWLHQALGERGVSEFWASRDGVKFDAAPDLDRAVRRGSVAAIVEGQALLAGGRGGELHVAYLVGSPTLYRVSARRSAEVWPLGYWRSRARAALERYREDQTQLARYSAPVADLVTEADDTVLVLRNREDRLGADYRLEVELGRRVDPYAVDSARTGTAEFGERIRWILRSRGREILGLTADGRVLRALLGPPQAGGIVD